MTASQECSLGQPAARHDAAATRIADACREFNTLIGPDHGITAEGLRRFSGLDPAFLDAADILAEEEQR